MSESRDKATFAMGCFWGVQVLFKHLKGVTNTLVGYTGGHIENPSYEMVCSGTTGHAEVLEMEFDPTVITFKNLLEQFFEHHDPTTPNRQGPDVGEQYRSAIFYHSEEQKRTAEEYIAKLVRTKRYEHPIVTELLLAGTFYPAEEYHQNYAEKNPSYVCHI